VRVLHLDPLSSFVVFGTKFKYIWWTHLLLVTAIINKIDEFLNVF